MVEDRDGGGRLAPRSRGLEGGDVMKVGQMLQACTANNCYSDRI